MSQKIMDQFLDFVSRNFLVEKEEIELDKSLIDEGIIDSFGLLEIATFIEKEYGIIVSEEHMNRDNFGSALKIVDFIMREKK